MIIGVVKETFPGERRVALVPDVVASLIKAGTAVRVESGAGVPAGFVDADYQAAGARLLGSRAEVFGQADVLCQVRTIGANPEAGRADLALIRPGQTLIGMSEPLTDLDPIRTLAGSGATTFAMELIPRITRAQSMDVLSSQATVAGYYAVLLAATTLPRLFPMMMTAAGTIAPARLLVVGAGVAGLQAIATARRNGAVVSGYDIRPAVKEQVESLGATFVEMELEAGASEDKGGYAKAMDDDFYHRQQELMAQVVADSDVVITTAAVPGRPAPVLVTTSMIESMRPGSVIVDLAAERGGNCELTKAGETVERGGVSILGPLNVPARLPFDASQMYARNLAAFLKHLVEDGHLRLDQDDEIVDKTLLTRDGEIVHRRVREILGLDPAEAAAAAE